MWQVRAEMVSRTGDLRAAKNRARQRRCQAVWGDGCSCRGIGSKLDGEQLCRNTGCAWNWGLGSEKSLEVAAAGQGWRGLWAGLEGGSGQGWRGLWAETPPGKAGLGGSAEEGRQLLLRVHQGKQELFHTQRKQCRRVCSVLEIPGQPPSPSWGLLTVHVPSRVNKTLFRCLFNLMLSMKYSLFHFRH